MELEEKLYQKIDRFIRSGDDQSHEIIESFAHLFDVMVVEYEESGSKLQLDDEFIQSVDRTSNLLKSLSRQQYVAAICNRVSGIQQRALSVLEDQFKSILDDYQYETDDEMMMMMISNLNKLANALIGGGHETECIELYFFVRSRNAMEQNLRFEKFSIDEMQKMQWESIEKEVPVWINMFKTFCTELLPSERRLLDAVFSSHTAISDTLFANFTRILLYYFLSFAEAVMMTKRSAEKLFKFLDIYEALRDNIPPSAAAASSTLITSMLGDSIFNIFIDLENSIRSDTAKAPVPGGAVHPLTRYTMNYLKYACEYSQTLEQIFREHKSRVNNDQQDEYSPFRCQLAKIMELLDANLEAKSRLYKEAALRLIFMMNNGRYILQKTKGTGEMRSLMGDPWVRKRSSDLRNYHSNYKRETWTKLLQCLSHEGLSVNGKVMKPVLKERFKSFNAMFDEIHRSQTTWVVSDEQLQSELRVSISAIVIPAYRSFMGRFSQVFTPGRQTEKYIKYQPEDIETCIEELFDGSIGQQSKKRSS